MKGSLIIAFEILNQPAFLAKAELISTSLTGNPHFPLPWPAVVTDPAALATTFANYQALAYAAESGDKAKLAARNAARLDLTTKLKKIAGYLELIADGNLAVLESTGYDLAHDTAHGTESSTLPAPADLQVERGPLSGALSVRVRALKGAGSYEVQAAVGDPAVAANWKPAALSKTATHIELKGLAPGTVYHVRVRGIGGAGPGAWAEAAGIMVV